MRCPFCNHEESKVTDSRSAGDINAIRRRRQCLKCERRFTTYETIDLTIQVHKRDGSYEDFKIEKLIRGLDEACSHTRISRSQVRELASEIASELTESQIREIETTKLGELVMHNLQKRDTIAYVRFACVYKRFKDVDQLMNAIHTITEETNLKK